MERFEYFLNLQQNMVKEVSAQFLAQTVNSEYAKRIEEINELTRQTGLEHSFLVYKILGREKVIYPHNNLGKKYTTGEERMIKQEIKPFYIINNFNDSYIAYLLLATHSHPNGMVCPSAVDLESLASKRRNYLNYHGLDIRPISVVTTNYSEDSNLLSVMMLQEKTSEPLKGKIFQEIEAEFRKKFDFSKNPKYKEIVIDGRKYRVLPMDEFYEETGFYNALAVHFEKRKGLSIPATNLEKFTTVLDLQ